MRRSCSWQQSSLSTFLEIALILECVVIASFKTFISLSNLCVISCIVCTFMFRFLKVAKSHGLAVRLTDIYLFSQSHDGSYFSHLFLRGSQFSFRSKASMIQKFFWLSCFMLNTFHSTALFVTTTCPDMLRNLQRPPHVPGMRSSVFIRVFF